MIHFSEFSGIGGFDLAAEWTGWKNYLSCEINPFGNKVLEYYWPAAYHHHDITTLTYDTINSELSKRFGPAWRNDDIIISGGFPCQPYSSAGKRLGKEDDRHLWPQMLRAIREIQPRWIVGENVRGIIDWNGGMVFDEIQADLETQGYQITPYLLPAMSVNADHIRDRIWFVAHSIGPGPENGLPIRARKEHSAFGNASKNDLRTPDRPITEDEAFFHFEDDGLSGRLDGITFSRWRNESIKAAGNAIVPQVAYQIFQAIQQYENDCKL